MPYDRPLEIPSGMNLDMLVFGGGYHDPELDLDEFERHMKSDPSVPQKLDWLNKWVESQDTCDAIIRANGHDGLSRVLRSIAEASSKHRHHMGRRVAAVAGFYELEVF